MAISESKGLLSVQGTQVTAAAMVQIYPLKNGSKWIFKKRKKKRPFKACDHSIWKIKLHVYLSGEQLEIIHQWDQVHKEGSAPLY